MSSPPKRSTAKRISERQTSSLVRSPSKYSASRPPPCTRRTVSRPSPRSRPCTTTFAPSPAKCSAMPRPMPEVDPVTTAILPDERCSWNQHRLDDPPSCIASNASRQPSSGGRQADDLLRGASRRRSSRWITRSQTGKLWLNDPCRRTFFWTSGLMLHGHEVRRPADLRHLAVRPRQRERHVERTAGAGRVAHEIGAERTQAAHDLLERCSRERRRRAWRRGAWRSRAAARRWAGRRRPAGRRRRAPPSACTAGQSVPARAPPRGRPDGSSS